MWDTITNNIGPILDVADPFIAELAIAGVTVWAGSFLGLFIKDRKQRKRFEEAIHDGVDEVTDWIADSVVSGKLQPIQLGQIAEMVADFVFKAEPKVARKIGTEIVKRKAKGAVNIRAAQMLR